nr:CGNR zinc finger domain-containing protein [Nocardiopsis alba]
MLADPEVALKECGRPDCTRLYLDRSRGARRTWCGMDECGNRVKAAAYRARRRARTHPDSKE